MGEVFKPCAGFPGYEVSDDGRVRSVASNWRGYGVRELAQHPNDNGYPSVRMTVEGKRKHIAVHRLVADAFLPPCPDDADQIRHLDGVKANSSASNLVWGNASTNALDRVRHGTQYMPPWHDAEFRAAQCASMRAAHTRNRKNGVGRYAK